MSLFDDRCIEELEEQIDRLKDKLDDTHKRYRELYNAVDNMFYDICNQWEDGMDIEELVGDLRKVMYDKEKGVR